MSTPLNPPSTEDEEGEKFTLLYYSEHEDTTEHLKATFIKDQNARGIDATIDCEGNEVIFTTDDIDSARVTLQAAGIFPFLLLAQHPDKLNIKHLMESWEYGISCYMNAIFPDGREVMVKIEFEKPDDETTKRYVPISFEVAIFDFNKSGLGWSEAAEAFVTQNGTYHNLTLIITSDCPSIPKNFKIADFQYVKRPQNPADDHTQTLHPIEEDAIKLIGNITEHDLTQLSFESGYQLVRVGPLIVYSDRPRHYPYLYGHYDKGIANPTDPISAYRTDVLTKFISELGYDQFMAAMSSHFLKVTVKANELEYGAKFYGILYTDVGSTWYNSWIGLEFQTPDRFVLKVYGNTNAESPRKLKGSLTISVDHFNGICTVDGRIESLRHEGMPELSERNYKFTEQQFTCSPVDLVLFFCESVNKHQHEAGNMDLKKELTSRFTG